MKHIDPGKLEFFYDFYTVEEQISLAVYMTPSGEGATLMIKALSQDLELRPHYRFIAMWQPEEKLMLKQRFSETFLMFTEMAGFVKTKATLLHLA